MEIPDQEAIPDQSEYIESLFDDRPAWIIILDAGRPDLFEDAAGTDDYEIVYNGGVTETTEWFKLHFGDGQYDLAFFNAAQPIRRINQNAPKYDDFYHFEFVESRFQHIPPKEINNLVRAYIDDGVAEQLNALGYTEDMETPDSGIIRYVVPHIPYSGVDFSLPDGPKGILEETADALNRGQVEYTDFWGAYVSTYKGGYESAERIADDLPGTVVVTADHGECLGDCDQLFHGLNYPEHDHLVNVPWKVISDGR